MSPLGVWIVGAAGHVGTCALAGWAALREGLLPPVGLVTAGPLAALPLVGLSDAVFGGHEVRERSLLDTLDALIDEGVLPAAIADAPSIQATIADAQGELRVGVTGALGGWADLQRVRAELDDFRRRRGLERVVVLNVASTEASPEADIPADPDGLFAALQAGLALPPSAIYAAAALDLGMAFVNFTPSIGSDLPALHALAERRGAVHAGADGKTGQTLVKTALAPMFAIRQLRVGSWVSHNVLGNEDGRALAEPARRASKQRSKAAALPAILGYEPESKVGIDYVPSYGDWKVAWDRVVFTGFGGATMTLEMTWRGSDTALAAPLCIDLVRLVELAQRRGERGVLSHLAVFFKNPIGTTEHRLERQWQTLVDHLTLVDPDLDPLRDPRRDGGQP
jgi:myo-inositol-1-phosphate synthase